MAFWFEFEKISDLPNRAWLGELVGGYPSQSDRLSNLTLRFSRNGFEWLLSLKPQAVFARSR
ncbi:MULTISPECIES: hypothetical protein [unclassified Neorhizobium]|uniref:hypothetical protein n=1 Tax=unclassified Neorhizobium TaxID=2629175 RepID=UPI001FF4C5D5|nr:MULTISPECIES: hypothetical protein [unclassified Neorhizobium]MCJ9670373.1 hypothetical protein [Neorhizobium sp. SHOUNA12B]MCJ9746313.1 hypothetical protein [Neorhizobium sp. SHOUNA12A]